jgi:hypothetical protein
MAKEFGIERIGFLTLTFEDNVIDHREASRRFHSLRTGVLKGRYERGAWARQRQSRGAVHFHCVVPLKADIRTGVDFEAFANMALPRRQRYASAPKALKAEWSAWRDIAPRYHFGRTELLPVRSTKEGIAKYVGRYIGKDFSARLDIDKGARFYGFWGYGPGERHFRPGFMTAGEWEWLWRQKVKYFALSKGITSTMLLTVPIGQHYGTVRQKPALEHEPIQYYVKKTGLTKTLSDGMEVLTHFFGKRWAYEYRDDIIDTDLPPGIVFPSRSLAEFESERRHRALQFQIGRASITKRPVHISSGQDTD